MISPVENVIIVIVGALAIIFRRRAADQIIRRQKPPSKGKMLRYFERRAGGEVDVDSAITTLRPILEITNAIFGAIFVALGILGLLGVLH